MIHYKEEVERFGKFELQMTGREDDALFADSGLWAEFSKDDRHFVSEGFYDGEGRLLIRFMPDEEGDWSFRVNGASAPAGGYAGQFHCLPAGADNHGPVSVSNATLFAYADGKLYTPFGTLLEAWHVQDESSRDRTIRTLSASPFNKARMSVVPQAGHAGDGETDISPFALRPDGQPDGDCFEPAYFAKLEACVESLSRIGVEAELILFPSSMDLEGAIRLTAEQEERYIRYAVSRLAAYRNVWWTMADLGDGTRRREVDWRAYFQTLRECDYGHHLCSIHGTPSAFDWGVPWLTHVSLRQEDVMLASDLTLQYEKPIVIDDCGREGIGAEPREALTSEDMAYRIWEGLSRGGFAAHGESLRGPDGTSWSVHGGELLGESVERIAFLRGLLEDAPGYLTYSRQRHDASTLEKRGEYYLQYFGPHRFSSRDFGMQTGEFAVDIIDTWNMTIERLDQTFQQRFQIKLPGEIYYALRLRKIGEGAEQDEPKKEQASA
ncbi:hypothetical protein PAT3040_01532 [Paenibacillus agaridevorans]|uniref:DUF5060 domain-containing protein n=1 Tax=Paenibacillus agaridevorans TaxID=171404 RepID=A0A2R5ELK9_9BACL|nr:DUF5605 domain-containing protein [Paenibacillus agaridevorans]GBG06985.1 hypothetical protein PAT3040_01532 [Paenibacillus agaridevorans]